MHLPVNITLMSQTLVILVLISFHFGFMFSQLPQHANSKLTRLCLLGMSLLTSSSVLAYVIQLELPQWRNLSFAFIASQMWYGPLLWLYTKLQTDQYFRLQRKLLIHFIPAPLFALLWLNQLPLNAGDLLYFAYAHDGPNNVQNYRLVHKFGAWCSLLGYSLACLKLLKPHQENMKKHYSELSKVDLKWLKALPLAALFTVIICVFIELCRGLGLQHPVNSGDIIVFVTLIFTLVQLQLGMKQIDIFQQHEPAAKPIQRPAATKTKPQDVLEKKYQTSSLTHSAAAELWHKVQHLMQQQQPYLETGLKISELAAMLDVSVNHLSETFNGYAQRSFYDYINEYRVNEARQLLIAPNMRRYSVTDIGYQVGFSSSSTFYTHFKKLTGMTPRQYRAEQLSIKPC